MIHSIKKAIESVWSLFWCRRRWLCGGLWSRGKSINLLLSITPFILNSIPWYRIYTSFGALDMSCAPIDCVITNGIIPLNYFQTTWILNLIFTISPIISEGNGMTVLEFCFLILFFNTWKICP